MNIESFRQYCLSKKGVTEELPFGPDTLVFKVMGKVFAILPLERIPSAANLKCNPELAEQLREEFNDVIEGYHMNKKHWNTVLLTSSEYSSKTLMNWIDHSYDLVVAGLTKSAKEKLNKL